MVLSLFESWASIGLDVAPLKATAFGLRVRDFVKTSAFSAEVGPRLSVQGRRQVYIQGLVVECLPFVPLGLSATWVQFIVDLS